MNRNITLLFYFFMLSTSIACAQTDTLRIYYDADWTEISGPKKAVYYRIAYPGDSGQWHVRDFYKAGQLQMSGTFLNRAMQRSQGMFEWFYPDGTLKQKGLYANGRQVGEHFLYYENGQLDTYEKYDDSGKLLEDGLFARDGSKSVREMAEFPGGTKDMYKFIKKHARRPRRVGSGRVVVSFVVDTTGSVTNIETIQWSAPELVDIAVNMLEAMPKWKPAKRDQVPVSMKYNLPIVFK